MYLRAITIILLFLILSCIDIFSPSPQPQDQSISVTQFNQIKGTWVLKRWLCITKYGRQGEGWSEDCSYYPTPDPPETLTFISPDSNYHYYSNRSNRFSVSLDSSMSTTYLKAVYIDSVGSTVFDSICTRNPQFSFTLKSLIEINGKTRIPSLRLAHYTGAMYFSKEWFYYFDFVN